MTSPARAKSPRRGSRSAGQVIVGALILLGVVASVFLVFSQSVQLLRVGLVVALWAAILGAIAMTKYRRESAVDRAKVRDLQTVYQLQLEREIAARREFEAGVEARVRKEVDGGDLAALRDELAALRMSLELLFDGELPVERLALRADTVRIPELTNGSFGNFAPTPQFSPDVADRPQFATPYDEPVTAETSIVGYARPSDEDVVPVRRRRAAVANDPDGTHSTGLSVAEIMANLRSENDATSPGATDAADAR